MVRHLDRIDPTDLREHADGERIDRVWQRLETALPLTDGRGPRRLGWFVAANVAGLGRSLYSEHLLPVELGGTLLLVATIGAIAITGRGPRRVA